MGRITWAGIMTALAMAGPLPAQDARPGLALLPFENSGSYGQDKEVFEALELGIPALLSSALAGNAGVRVADANAVRGAMEGRKLGGARRVDAGSASEVAKTAGARYVITGSFADFYGKFRINARVVDAQSGQILKVVSNDDPKLQDRAQLSAILAAVADKILATAGVTGGGVKALPSATEALTDFSRGLLWESRGDRGKAGAAFQRALASAPDFVEARDGLRRARGS
jgi:TolB-like protein